MRINEFSQELVIVGINRVVVCQVMRRVGSTQCARRVRPEITEINEVFKAVCNASRVYFKFYMGFWNIRQQILGPDVVHSNDLGSHK